MPLESYVGFLGNLALGSHYNNFTQLSPQCNSSSPYAIPYYHITEHISSKEYFTIMHYCRETDAEILMIYVTSFLFTFINMEHQHPITLLNW